MGAVSLYLCNVPTAAKPIPLSDCRAYGIRHKKSLAEREGFEPPIRLPVCRISFVGSLSTKIESPV
jgi:hypothetical protein